MLGDIEPWLYTVHKAQLQAPHEQYSQYGSRPGMHVLAHLRQRNPLQNVDVKQELGTLSTISGTFAGFFVYLRLLTG